MTTATAPAVEKRKKPWTKARVIDLIIDIFCFVIVGAASLTCILPFIHILAKSLSDNAYVVANRVILLPMSDAGINLDAYNKVFHDPTIMQSLWVTALVTVVFTAIGMFLTVCASYALTRPEFHGRKVFTFMIMFTMYFTAGTIPAHAGYHLVPDFAAVLCTVQPVDHEEQLPGFYPRKPDRVRSPGRCFPLHHSGKDRCAAVQTHHGNHCPVLCSWPLECLLRCAVLH